MKITPSHQPLQGEFKVPGDKSISHRALIIASILGKPIQIENLNGGDDVQRTVNALQEWGVHMASSAPGSLIVNRNNPWQNFSDTIDLGNSGTSARMLMGLASTMPWETKFIGDESLSKRPMKRVTEPLSLMGASFYSESNDHANLIPMTVLGSSNLSGISYEMPIASAQVKSAIIIAGLFAKGITTIQELQPTRDHTERMLQHFGVPIDCNQGCIKLTGIGGNFKKSERSSSLIVIANDPSAAAFLIVAALIIPESYVQIRGVCTNPLRSKYLDVLKSMGGRINFYNTRIQCGEEVADITASYTPDLRAVELSGDLSAALIDEYPILAVAAAHAKGISVFKGLQELKVKESNRLATTLELLQEFGVRASAEGDADLVIYGGTYNPNIKSIVVDANLDHRIAMSAAVMGSLHQQPFTINGSEAAETSFPGFYKIFS